MLPEVLKAYGGKVGLEFVNNPLGFHPNAMPAAKASLAAHLQGRFWEMHDLIFRNQKTLSLDAFVAFARQIGLDMDRFQWDMADARLEQFIREEQAAVAALGLKGTPMFVINGTVIQGAQPASKFKELIDVELKKADEALAAGTPRDQLEEALARRNGADERFVRFFLKGERPQTQAGTPAEKKNDEGAPAADDTRWKVKVTDKDPSLGPPSAPLTIVVFSDFQCPHSARTTATIRRILETHGKDVRVVFKNFPLPFHKDAMPAAQAALAAGVQGRFWEMHDLLFENQDALSIAELEGYAEELKLDVARFRRDLATGAFNELIETQVEDAEAVGVRGTPNVFYNGRLVRGAQSYDQVKQLVLAEIEKGKQVPAARGATPYEALVADGKEFVPFSQQSWQLDSAGAPARGDGTEVEIVVFSEFECPYCKTLKEPIEKLLDLYPGRARLVYRSFPLERHADAHLAAQAALAAHAQGKYWDMHDKLFATQGAHGRDKLEQYAAEIGLDVERFRKELLDGTWKAAVDRDVAEGKKAGVNGTPTVFVNGRLYQGTSRDAKSMAKAIDKHILGK